MRLASLDCVRIYTVSVRCRFCVRVFYHVGRVLSAVAKFHVYLVGKGKGWLKWERGEVKEKSGERRGKAENGNARNIAPKCNRFGIWKRPLGLPPRVTSSLQGQHLHR